MPRNNDEAPKRRGLIRSSAAEYLTFVAASGVDDVNAVYADETVWLTQKMMGVLYDVETQTVNYHLKKVFADKELAEDAVIRKFRITAADGKHYNIQHYSLAAIIAAQRKIPMSMQDWETRLNRFIEATDRDVLRDAGKVTAAIAKAYAESEFEKYRVIQDRRFESDFDRLTQQQALPGKPEEDKGDMS